MKRFLRLLPPTCAMAITFAVLAWASHVTYNAIFVNESGLTYSKTYTLDTLNMGLTSLTMQAVYSTATFKTASITDGAASTGTITVSSYTALHGTEGTNTLTIVSGKNSHLAASPGTDTISVASNTSTALSGASISINGNKLLQGRDWFVATSSAGTASSIASSIVSNLGLLATASGSTVTITCNINGTFCNSYALTTSTAAALVAGSSKFTGGQDAVYFTLNGTALTNGIDWTTGASSTNTASSMATAANTVAGFVATTSSNVVTVSCTSSGTFCNAYTLATSSSAWLSVGGAKFTGGVNSALLVINGIVLTEGKDFTATTSSAVTATNIAAAINANSSLNAIIVSTAIACPGCGIVIATSTAVGSGTNYSLWTSTYAALKPFAAAMKGGKASAIVTASKAISVANDGYTKGLALLYAKSAGTSPANLVSGTTYYAVPLDANTFQLSTTSTGAVAGTPIVSISTQAAAGGGTFTFTPLAYTGTASWQWEGSNDNVNFNAISISSVTYSSPSATPTTTLWDFDSINFRYLRLDVIGPTQGGLTLVVTGTGRGEYR